MSVRGSSVRSIERVTGLHRDTILRILVVAGKKCEILMGRMIVNVPVSPPEVTSAEKVPVMGNPDPAKICTSHVERQNLTMRMHMRRLTRLTNAFSKKWDNLWAALCLHFAWYNFVRIHQTLRVTPAMQAGVTGQAWEISDLLA